MVNLSRKTSFEKSLLPLMSKKSLKISKTKSPSPSIAHTSPLSETKITKSSFSLETSPEKLDFPDNLYNILQPFCNMILFPSDLQKLVGGSEKLNSTNILQKIYQLKTPNNSISFQKKMEKMKLLSLGQEIIIQNYLKDKFSQSGIPEILQEYYRFLKSKMIMEEEIDELINRYNRVNEDYDDQSVKKEYPNEFEDELMKEINEKTGEDRIGRQKDIIYYINEGNHCYDGDKLLAKEEYYLKIN